MRKNIILILLALFFPGCAYFGYLKDPFSDIRNFHQVNPQIYRGGRLNKQGWSKLKSLGIKTIIDLKESAPNEFSENIEAKTLGFKKYSIPISLYSPPSDEEVLKFLKLLLDPNNQPVFVYCNNGRDRTGVMIAIYRVVVDGWTIKNAYHEAVSLGYWPYYGEKAPLKIFIHQLKEKRIYFEKVKEFKNEKNN